MNQFIQVISDIAKIGGEADDCSMAAVFIIVALIRIAFK